ncbi:MAG TPA: hypothetical protein VEA58_14655 [Anaerovoracaceae bacterium]|nr:hypothetical protein [Anaerovoracaceae bacterium]
MYMGGCVSFEQMKIIFTSRIFWRQLAIRMREYLNSRYLGIGNAEDIFIQLLNAPTEFSGMLKLLFGEDVSEKYNQLLTQYIMIIRELITAQLDGNREAINQNVKSLYQNGDIRAASLAPLNPIWNEAEWKKMIATFNNLTIEEANSIASGDYGRNIELYDNLTVQTNIMGDYFAHGLYHYLTDTTPGFDQPLTTGECISFDQMTILYYIKIFWLEMTTWTRAYIISRVINSDYANKAYEKLRQVPIQYGNLMKTIFNEEMVDQNLQLIYKHINLINNLITALVNNNQEGVNSAVQFLFQNSDERAALLAQMNPNLDQNQWSAILHNFLRSTIDEITSFLNGDYERNIEVYQHLIDQTEQISNTFTESLFKYITVNQSSL